MRDAGDGESPLIKAESEFHEKCFSTYGEASQQAMASTPSPQPFSLEQRHEDAEHWEAACYWCRHLFSSVKRVDDLSSTYAGTKINGFCELIPQHGNRPQKPNKKGLCYACNNNPMDTQKKTCGIHRKLGNLIILFVIWFSWVLKQSLRSCFLPGHGGTCF